MTSAYVWWFLVLCFKSNFSLQIVVLYAIFSNVSIFPHFFTLSFESEVTINRYMSK